MEMTGAEAGLRGLDRIAIAARYMAGLSRPAEMGELYAPQEAYMAPHTLCSGAGDPSKRHQYAGSPKGLCLRARPATPRLAAHACRAGFSERARYPAKRQDHLNRDREG